MRHRKKHDVVVCDCALQRWRTSRYWWSWTRVSDTRSRPTVLASCTTSCSCAGKRLRPNDRRSSSSFTRWTTSTWRSPAATPILDHITSRRRVLTDFTAAEVADHCGHGHCTLRSQYGHWCIWPHNNKTLFCWSKSHRTLCVRMITLWEKIGSFSQDYMAVVLHGNAIRCGRQNGP